MDYNPQLDGLANRFIAAHLSPDYVSIHWRIEWTLMAALQMTEEGRIGLIQRCARGLISTATSLLNDPQLFSKEDNVNVDKVNASDCAQPRILPSSSSSSLNGSLSMLSPLVSSCNTRLFLATDITLSRDNSRTISLAEREHAAAVDAVRQIVAALSPRTGADVRATVWTVDEGQQAIMEKLLARKGRVFLMAPDGCGGTSSYFTQEIVNWRQRHNLPVQAWVLDDE